MKPTYFDLTVRDLDQSREFFSRVFGWRFERFPMPYEYYRIQAGPQDEPGIDGGIGSVSDAPISGGSPMTQVTVPVPDLDAVMARVKESGGQIVEPKMRIPGIGWYATCAEPGGLRFGIIQLDPAAGQTVERRTRGGVNQIAALEKAASRSSLKRSGHSVILPVAGLCGLAVFTSLYWMFAALLGVQASSQSGFIWLLGFSLFITWFVEVDRRCSNYSAPFEFSAFVFFGWPLLLPWYLFNTRGSRGLLWATAAFALFLGPFLTALIAYAVLGAMQ